MTFDTYRINIYFFSKGYDAHFIFNHIEKSDFKNIDVIAKSMEKFINFTCAVEGSDWSLDFKDSLAFLSSPLEKLTENLKCKVMTSHSFKFIFLIPHYIRLTLNLNTLQIVTKYTSNTPLISSEQDLKILHFIISNFF